jgi:hypothetical protein
MCDIKIGADTIQCSYCRRDMETSKGCTCVPYVSDDGEVLQPIRFGDEGIEKLQLLEICPDCSCKKGYFHHIGCDVEQCPICKERATICDCSK